MNRNKDSELIVIPKGYPFWYEPMMENLYTLERLAKAGGGGEGGGQVPLDIQEQIDTIKQNHSRDISIINIELAKLNSTISGDEEGQQGLLFKVIALEKKTSDHANKLKDIEKNTASITKLQGEIESVESTIIMNQESVNQEVLLIYKEIDKLRDLINGDGEGSDLSEVLAQIKEIQETIQQLKASIQEAFNEINKTDEIVIQIQKDINTLSEAMETIQATVKKIEAQMEEHSHQIVELGSAVLSNAKSIDRLEDLIIALEGGIKDSHHIVNTKQEMEAITQKKQGSLCFVRNIASMFIWDGQWSAISSSLDLKEVGWDDIVGAPTSSPMEIDKTVEVRHTHGNKGTLDLITHSKINEWDSKAEKEDVPTKLSDLENDIGAGGDYDEAIATINKSIGKIGLLSTNEKSDLVSAINEINAKVQSVTDLERLVLELSEKVAYLEK